MAPPRPPPDLIDDAIEEILLRIPPDEPAYLFRAALVCKLWRRILSAPTFLRRYRRFHGTPPLLGFFHEASFIESTPRFFPTTTASPYHQVAFESRRWSTLDCRHGRVLLQMEKDKFVVWHPITGYQEELPKPNVRYEPYSIAVLCAASGCDHRDCHGGPFLVVYAGNTDTDSVAHACVYSSEAGAWGTPVYLHTGMDGEISYDRGALIGGSITDKRCFPNFMLGFGDRILKYDLGKHRLSVMDPPDRCLRSVVLMPTEDGFLGIAGISGSSLYLWWRKANTEGVEEWVQHRVIELQKLIPIEKSCDRAYVIGFAEGADVIFMSTNVSTFIIEFKSGRARKISDYGTFGFIVPFMTFCTPGMVPALSLFQS